MAWLWSSWKEFLDYVQPAAVRRGAFGIAQRGPWFDTEVDLMDAVREITDALAALEKLGFTGNDNARPPADDTSIPGEARGVVIHLIYAGEELLLYHKRLAQSDYAYGFLHQHDILEHWERYLAEGRACSEIDQLVKDARPLLEGYHQMRELDDKLLVSGLDLPSDLEADFLLARNLFSVGFDEVGLLIAGRGLEGVLRKIAQSRKINIQAKGRVEPAADADLHDLIEVMSRLRWKATGTRLVRKETQALLHYLRALRNAGAHAHPEGRSAIAGPREMASIVAETANRLWNDVTSTRAKFDQTTVQKTW